MGHVDCAKMRLESGRRTLRPTQAKPTIFSVHSDRDAADLFVIAGSILSFGSFGLKRFARQAKLLSNNPLVRQHAINLGAVA